MIQTPPPPPPVVLVVLMDDVGAEESMPILDSLSQTGVTFTRAYAHPWCAPTRDSLLFGQFAGEFRGHLCEGYLPGVSHEAGEPSLMRTLEDDGWGTWLIGKWHQGNAPRSSIGWEEAPLFWFRHWLAGTAYALNAMRQAPCNDPNLWQYPTKAGYNLVANDGFLTTDGRYDMEREWEAAVNAISQALLTPEPDLIVFAPQAAHAPWITPPAFMLPPGYVTPPSPTDRDLYLEETMALDWVIGDLVALAGPSAWVAITSDNGTPCPVDADTLRSCKGDVYEGGVRVPMVLLGPGLLPGEDPRPVHIMDVASTILASAGAERSWHQGQDLFGARRPWAAVRNPGVGQAIIEERYKLIRFDDGTEEFYDLCMDPQETTPLALSGPDYDRLSQTMSLVYP